MYGRQSSYVQQKFPMSRQKRCNRGIGLPPARSSLPPPVRARLERLANENVACAVSAATVIRMRATVSLLFAFAAFAAAAPRPGDALKAMRVAPGFEVKLVASEPDVRQPLTMSFDGRGRLWVVQYLQYPNPAGLKAVSVDQYLRTKYDRVPEPPPRGPKGADRITIGEDTDGDGVPDKFKDFVTGLNLASGMALGYGGVFVAQPPYLLFYADRNHDDIPDGDPEVLLTGFGMEDAHAFANSLQFGPDGWLYGAQGSTVTADIRGVGFQQGIWRYHPVTREFELFAEGGGNTWGLDFDEDGEVLAGTNFGELIGLHQVQGGYYVKGFAKHGPLHNPHTYGYLEHMPYTGWKGGRVICGGVSYDGGEFPGEFNRTYVAANLLRRTIDWHVLERTGSTYRGRYGGTFIETDDTTFRPIDCTVGPDGAVYVADWCDVRASHVDPVDNWEKDTGRIYKIAPERRSPTRREAAQRAGSEPGAAIDKFDLAKFSSDELVNQLTNRNGWFRRQARQLLAERRDAKVIPRLRSQSLQTRDGALALQSLWALNVSGGFDDALAAALLEHPYPPVRVWTVRLLGDTRKLAPKLAQDVSLLARSERDARVRRQLACSAKRWPATTALPVLRELIGHDEDTNDLHIPLLLWWAIEDKVTAPGGAPRSAVLNALLSSAADWDRPLMREQLLERLVRRVASELAGATAPAGPAADKAAALQCVWLLDTAGNSAQRAAVWRGFDKAWEGQRVVRESGMLREAFGRTWSRERGNALALRVGLRLAYPEAQSAAIARLTNSAAAESERVALAETLGQSGVESAIPSLLHLLRAGAKLQQAAVSALQGFSRDDLAPPLLAAYPGLTAGARAQVRTALASRANWAAQLVRAVEEGTFDAKELSPDLLRQMIRHSDASLTAAIEKRWGKLQAQSSAEKTSTVNQLKLVLNPSGTTLRFKGDAAEGKKLFTTLCATCHKLFGEGNTIGPELTGSDRRNVDWLLGQMVDPSAFIRPEYVNHNVEMKDGRSLSGLLVEQSDSALTLLDARNQRTVLNRNDVKELNASSTSLMPEGLLESLTPQQVRDLFAYLQQTP